MTDIAPRFRIVALFTLLLLLNEIVSYVGYSIRPIGLVVFVLLLLLTLVLSLRRLEYGLIIVCTELFIGGKGYLYSADLGSLTLSIRLGLFVILMTVWALRYRLKVQFPTSMNAWTIRLLSIFSCVVLWGIVNGVIRGHGLSNVFFDANAYFFFALLVVLVRPQLDRAFLLRMLLASLAAVAVVLGVKSLFSLGIFAHWNIDHLATYYRWIRNTGVGEIAYINGSSYRVFFQSQVYGMLAFITLAVFTVPNSPTARTHRWLLLPMVFGMAAVLVSLSRSFWLGGALALCIGLSLGGFRLRWNIRQWLQVLTSLAALGMISFTLMSWSLNFPRPFPPSRGTTTASIIGERFSHFGGEAAASSRLQMLGPLTEAILDRPLFGSGFAQTVTYQSNDPRQTSLPSKGLYTTDAFEWGYLDIALKIGILGLAAYLALISTVLRTLWRSGNIMALGFFTGITALLGVHLTTPYLNHPLGIGFLLITLMASSYVSEHL